MSRQRDSNDHPVGDEDDHERPAMNRCDVCPKECNLTKPFSLQHISSKSNRNSNIARSCKQRRHCLVWIASVGLLVWSAGRFVGRIRSGYGSERSFWLASRRVHRPNNTDDTRRQQQHQQKHQQQRLLLIATSLSEVDTGTRQTVAGYDRFAHTILPVLRESVTSLTQAATAPTTAPTTAYQVDVYFIAHYSLSSTRYNELRAALPDAVGLEVWDDATPIGYERENSLDHVRLHTRGLSRQHRYVLKDKYWDYDLFVCMEDDMLIRSDHVDHYVRMTDTLYQWRRQRTTTTTVPPTAVGDQSLTAAQWAERFHGPMTTRQLARTIPGFMRVEVARPDFVPSTKPHLRLDQIPVDYSTTWARRNDTNNDKRKSGNGIDPSICCHVSPQTVNDHIPASPDRNDLYFWEMSLESLGVRKMPPTTTNNTTTTTHPVLDWVVVLGGSNNEMWEDGTYIVGDYWSGRGPPFYFGPNPTRPDRREGRFANNQGGWMATRRQVAEWHLRWCRGGLLPPYNPPFYQDDGLDGRSVEYWSGGIQLVGVNSCNLQRIVSMDPEGFSRQLLYHTSNNKQLSGRVKRQFSGRSIHEFWGQLNTICKNAELVRLDEVARQGV